MDHLGNIIDLEGSFGHDYASRTRFNRRSVEQTARHTVTRGPHERLRHFTQHRSRDGHRPTARGNEYVRLTNHSGSHEDVSHNENAGSNDGPSSSEDPSFEDHASSSNDASSNNDAALNSDTNFTHDVTGDVELGENGSLGPNAGSVDGARPSDDATFDTASLNDDAKPTGDDQLRDSGYSSCYPGDVETKDKTSPVKRDVEDKESRVWTEGQARIQPRGRARYQGRTKRQATQERSRWGMKKCDNFSYGLSGGHHQLFGDGKLQDDIVAVQLMLNDSCDCVLDHTEPCL